MEIKFRANSQLAADYLRYLFNAPATGPIRLSTTNDFGRMAVGLFKVSDEPVEVAEEDLTLTLILPKHQPTYIGMTRYLYFTQADQKRLNFILDALLNIDLDTYYIKGIQAGIPKKDVIESFVVSRRLVSSDYDETLGKRAYRNSLAAMRRRTEQIFRKARYHHSLLPSPTDDEEQRI